jgi:hypothetical protein
MSEFLKEYFDNQGVMSKEEIEKEKQEVSEGKLKSLMREISDAYFEEGFKGCSARQSGKTHYLNKPYFTYKKYFEGPRTTVYIPCEFCGLVKHLDIPNKLVQELAKIMEEK